LIERDHRLNVEDHHQEEQDHHLEEEVHHEELLEHVQEEAQVHEEGDYLNHLHVEEELHLKRRVSIPKRCNVE
jgi:hypothetical protein